ncbi:LuxR C-terminal-related transcriptional regulator [Allokutzneria sp. A3M-2-11 16]|uniref:helix-turn-helix transcriptional regulator n=1 Tax=Allokutzneria sp. A3M-2-11 16 TaxID=2962043 RepID=UPI0020B8FEF3|nr:LuxR C-terminal-related transcriptional regulator [Allokutzneria sp. A3M-2-11 16]MCP3803929.1 LuxR C-terminal-related transcriptional regulator [Allokutzneria sp. A3M-2-11 16]
MLEAADYRAMFRILEAVERLDTAERFSATLVEQLAREFGWRSLIFQLSPTDFSDFRAGRVCLRTVRFTHNVRPGLVDEMVERWGDYHPLGPGVSVGMMRSGVVAASQLDTDANEMLRDYFDSYVHRRGVGDVLHAATDAGARGGLGLCAYTDNGPRERLVLAKLSKMLVPFLRQHPAVVDTRDDGLTEREALVARLVAEGHPNQEIALQLGISLGTVKKHLSRALAKTGSTSRTQLAFRLARRVEPE